MFHIGVFIFSRCLLLYCFRCLLTSCEHRWPISGPGPGVGGSSSTTTRALKTNKSWQMDTLSTTRFYYQRCHSHIPERKSAPHAPKQMTFYLVVPQFGNMRSSSPSLMQSRGPSIHKHVLSRQRHHPRLSGCSDTQRRRQL